MTISIIRSPDDDISERCCFCRTSTPFWTDRAGVGRIGRDDVACCESCARRAHPGDIPSKAVWFRRESICDRSYAARELDAPEPDEVASIGPAARHSQT